MTIEDVKEDEDEEEALPIFQVTKEIEDEI